MIYHIYLTNQFFPLLLASHLSRGQVPVLALNDHYVSHSYRESCKFLMAQEFESRNCESCNLWGLFSPFVMIVSNLQHESGSFFIFLFIFLYLITYMLCCISYYISYFQYFYAFITFILLLHSIF